VRHTVKTEFKRVQSRIYSETFVFSRIDFSFFSGKQFSDDDRLFIYRWTVSGKYFSIKF